MILTYKIYLNRFQNRYYYNQLFEGDLVLKRNISFWVF